MLWNYLTVALRNIARHKLYSFINIAGLTVGLTCAIFIILFVRDQLSYDTWIPGTENLYRVENNFTLPGRPPMPSTKTPFVVTQAMLDQIPEVKTRTRLIRNAVSMRAGNRQFPEKVASVDPNFFQVIRLPLVAGDPATVLAQPDSVVISEAKARKYFGAAPALNRILTLSAQYCDEEGNNCQSRQHDLRITGLVRDLPHNTQMSADLLISNIANSDPTPPDAKTNWFHTEGWGYVQLVPGADPKAVTAKLRALLDRSVNLKALKLNIPTSQVMIPRLTRFRDAHLSTDQYGGMTPAGNWPTVYGFAAIGVLILMVACFNFTNLATARAMTRAREISLRKVVGATRRQLMFQFLGEAVLTALIALALALALAEMLLPSFDRFLGLPIAFHYFRDWPVSLSIITIGLLVGLLSGAYPALILSGFRPIAALRSNASRQSGSGLLRTLLVVLQFAVSIGLGIAVLVVFAQISFARDVDLGFHKDGILVMDGQNLSAGSRESFVRALKVNSGIADAAISDSQSIPFTGSDNNLDVSLPGSSTSQVLRVMSTGPDYANVYGIKLIAGRFLSDGHSGDRVTDQRGSWVDYRSAPYNIMINEAAAHRLGLSKTDAVGKTLTAHGVPVTIVGVIADVKIDGAAAAIMPTIYRYIPEFSSWISVSVRPVHLPDTLSFIDRTWHAFAPGTAMRRYFLNDDFEGQFRADEQQGTIFGIFVSIAIFIAALGLFGLAAFSSQRRTREIGLRKAFGARSRDIVLMLLWQFSIPVLIANFIAWPVAYYYLHHWLEGYAYRIDLNPLYFLGAGLAALIIAWTTVFAHAQRVARTNPIHALRYE
ncbi:MAG TPA: FtsX-like permease family protein [Rhizomicrobium sp.]|jgi:putative ABC transport system permease protein